MLLIFLLEGLPRCIFHLKVHVNGFVIINTEDLCWEVCCLPPVGDGCCSSAFNRLLRSAHLLGANFAKVLMKTHFILQLFLIETVCLSFNSLSLSSSTSYLLFVCIQGIFFFILLRAERNASDTLLLFL